MVSQRRTTYRVIYISLSLSLYIHVIKHKNIHRKDAYSKEYNEGRGRTFLNVFFIFVDFVIDQVREFISLIMVVTMIKISLHHF